MDAPVSFHFRHRRTIEFADADPAGVMHFTNVLKFVESAEHAFLHSLGDPVYSPGGPGWPRVEVACRYLKPARFGQALETCLRVVEIRASGLQYGFWIFLADEPGSPLVATGSCTIVHARLGSRSREVRKIPIPSGLRKRLNSIR